MRDRNRHPAMITSPLRAWLFATLVLTFSSGFPARAQDTAESSSSPPPPYVGTLKGNFTFTKKYTYKPQAPGAPAPAEAPDTSTPPAPALAELDSIQTRDLRKDKCMYVDGTSRETWRVGPNRFFIFSSNPNDVVVAMMAFSNYQDPEDFGELDWINPSFFQGEQLLGDKKCYLYKQGNTVAWIQESNRLPLLFESPLEHIDYGYGTPASVLHLPPLVDHRLQQMNRDWSGMPAKRE